MTRDERLLLARVLRRAHADGWVRCYSYAPADRRGHVWVDTGHIRRVTWDRGACYLSGPGFWCVPDSLDRALTWLAAAGIVPADDGPSYRHGYAAGRAAGWKAGLEHAGRFDYARLAVLDAEVAR